MNRLSEIRLNSNVVDCNFIPEIRTQYKISKVTENIDTAYFLIIVREQFLGN